MSKMFKFSDGQSANGSKWDVRSGRPAVWTRSDLNYAVQAFLSVYSRDNAAQIYYHCCRVRSKELVPSYAFGAVIGMLTQALAYRPYEEEVANQLHLPTKVSLPKPKDSA